MMRCNRRYESVEDGTQDGRRQSNNLPRDGILANENAHCARQGDFLDDPHTVEPPTLKEPEGLLPPITARVTRGRWGSLTVVRRPICCFWDQGRIAGFVSPHIYNGAQVGEYH